MSIRTHWDKSSIRRNYRGHAWVASGNVPIARKATPSKAWQRDVTQTLSEIAKGMRSNPDDTLAHDPKATKRLLPKSVQRLKELARSVVGELRPTAEQTPGA